MINNLEALLRGVDPNRNGGGKSPNGEPYGPGTKLGFTIGQMRDFVKLQKRAKGYEIQTVANATTTTKLDISGTANVLLGFNVSTKIADLANLSNHKATLMVNNESIFEEVNLQFLNPNYNWKEEEFFPFPRPLSGNDDVTLKISSLATADLIFVEVYYI